MRKRPPSPPPQPIEWTRADPAALAAFDPATKTCTMNCGPASSDPRSAKERKLLCDDCLPAGGVQALASPQQAGWFLPYEAVSHLTSLPRLLEHAKRARWTNATVRKDGQETTYEADWIKHMRWVGPADAPGVNACVATNDEMRALLAGVDVPGEGKKE